ncbi:hypothetical protein KC356_g282 [Hortaea werneckii]|nr:hypothetical protein KC356_g282 [Hortaea werneckii]
MPFRRLPSAPGPLPVPVLSSWRERFCGRGSLERITRAAVGKAVSGRRLKRSRVVKTRFNRLERGIVGGKGFRIWSGAGTVLGDDRLRESFREMIGVNSDSEAAGDDLGRKKDDSEDVDAWRRSLADEFAEAGTALISRSSASACFRCSNSVGVGVLLNVVTSLSLLLPLIWITVLESPSWIWGETWVNEGPRFCRASVLHQGRVGQARLCTSSFEILRSLRRLAIVNILHGWRDGRNSLVGGVVGKLRTCCPSPAWGPDLKTWREREKDIAKTKGVTDCKRNAQSIIKRVTIDATAFARNKARPRCSSTRWRCPNAFDVSGDAHASVGEHREALEIYLGEGQHYKRNATTSNMDLLTL